MNQATAEPERRQVRLAQGTIRYRDTGSGPPIVFVHGLLVNGLLWREVVSELSGQFRCVVPDWPLGSHAEPMAPEADLSPPGVARLISEFLEALGLEEVTLVGNDTGGALCQFALDEDPSRIGRLVLTNCDGFDVFPPTTFKPLFALLRSERRIRLLAGQMKVRALRQSPLGYGLLAHDLPADLTGAWVEPVRRDAAVVHDLARFARAIDRADLLDVSTRLHRFRGPVTLAWGADDRAFTTALGRRLHDRFADARFVPVPGSRTFVPLDAPGVLADEIAAIATRPRTEPAQ
jgi:pimeloyl-ACP methyl ester carboxylesterase